MLPTIPGVNFDSKHFYFFYLRNQVFSKIGKVENLYPSNGLISDLTFLKCFIKITTPIFKNLTQALFSHVCYLVV